MNYGTYEEDFTQEGQADFKRDRQAFDTWSEVENDESKPSWLRQLATQNLTILRGRMADMKAKSALVSADPVPPFGLKEVLIIAAALLAIAVLGTADQWADQERRDQWARGAE